MTFSPTAIRSTVIRVRPVGTQRAEPARALWRLLRSTLLWLLPGWLMLCTSAAWAATRSAAVGNSAAVGSVAAGGVAAGGTALAAPANAAAAADEEAPMCDVHAASIAARPDVPEVDDGKVEALPCDVLLKLWGWGKDGLLETDGKTTVARHAAPPRPLETSAVPQRPEAVIAEAVRVPDPGPPMPLPESINDRLRGLRGHRTAIFRPPLARV